MSKESGIVFHETLSVSDFKSRCNVSKLDIIHNDGTGKEFFVCGKVTGAVSASWNAKDKETVVSDTEFVDGSRLWILHGRSTANVVATL